jgi:hypothetical protein
MKWTAITLTILTAILAILYATIGGTILLIGLSTIGLLTVILSCFGLGIWYAHKSIQLGAKIATEAVNNNDRWDSVKMKSLAQFGGEIFKLKGDNQAANGFPLLESNNDAFDASFTITGVDNE